MLVIAPTALGDFGIPECMGSNPGNDPNGDWASTRDNGSQMGVLSDERSSLGGLL